MRKPCAITVVLLTLHAGFAQASDKVDVKWAELAPQVEGRRVALVLPGGVQVTGKALKVEPEGLRMQVSKTSDKQAQPKGKRVIPRDSISTLRATHYGVKWRIAGATAPPVAALAITAATAPRDIEGPLVIVIPALAAAAAIGGAVAGYYIGKRADKRVTEIRIVK